MMKKVLCLAMMAVCFSGVFALPVLAAKDKAPAIPVQKLLNVNTATLQELEALPGIGPVSAQRIIDYRTDRGRFASVDQLVEVKGIGQKSLDKFRTLIVAE